MTDTQIALVTGGSRGLGRNMATSLAAKGLDVIVTYRSNREKAEEVVAEIRNMGRKAACLPLNTTSFTSFEGFFHQVEIVLKSEFESRAIDYLINNAGIGINVPISETSEDQLNQLIDIQFKGTFLLTQKALPYLNNGGGIVNISTGLTRFSLSGYSVYAAMKSAIETLTKYQAVELGERGIRSNVVAPGAIETDFAGGAVRDNANLNAMIANNTALGRVGLPNDIGGVVAFLCTEDARWINAQRIEVSGGQHL